MKIICNITGYMTETIGTLYKRGRNTILDWQIKVEQNNRQINIIISYGELDKKHTIRYRNNIKGKNKGKANETNAWEQAVADAHSEVNKKLKEGYKDLQQLIDENQALYFNVSLNTFLNEVLPEYNTDINGNEIPMKCQQYYRSKPNWIAPNNTLWEDRKYYYLQNPYARKEPNTVIIDFPCYVQPKINGVRAFIKKVNDKAVIFSKKGLVYNLPHISEFVEQNRILFNLLDTCLLDGELYIHNNSLQSIVSAVKTMQLETLNVKFYLFDLAKEDITQEVRFNTLYSPAVKECLVSSFNSPVVLVPAKKVVNDERVQQLTDMYIQEGYEGVICRSTQGLYEFGKRPKTITKLKRMVSREFTIVDVVGSEKDPTIGLYVCRTDEGKEFKVNPKGTIEFKREELHKRDSLIGKNLTCCFYEYTEDRIPFHIIDNIVRDYE